MPPPPPPPPPSIAEPPAAGQPWNPTTIALLGLALTPLWSGVMAAVNMKRLKLAGAWKPMAIGIGWLTAHIVVLLTPFNYYVIQLLLFAAGAWLVWCHALHEQIQPFTSRGSTKGSWVNWVIPGAAGLAGATFSFCTFILMPALPDSPNQVCDQMLRGEPDNRREYLTQRMWPVTPFLDWLTENMYGDFVLTQGCIDRDLAKAMPEVRGGCVVYFQLDLKQRRYPNRCSGFFFLVYQMNRWRIDEMYFTAIGDVNQGVNVPLTENAQDIRDLLKPPVHASGWTNQFPPKPIEFTRIPIHTSPSRSRADGWKSAMPILGRLLFHSGVGKKLMLFVILLALGKFGYDRVTAWWHDQKQHPSE